MTKRPISLLLALTLTAAGASAVTLNVTVPEGTKVCYVVGAYNGWDPANGTKLTRVSSTQFTLTDDAITESALCQGYKYVCGPSWSYVEKDASGGEVGNRTSIGNPDIVPRWASVYAPNENIHETTLRLNGYDRKVRILVPDGYDDATASYPVIYYVGVQKRYNNAGDDADCGDDLFGAVSWDLASRLEELPAAQETPAIIVATYSFVAENIPYPAADFAGSGASDAYLADFTSVLKAYVDANYRTLPDAANTAIFGADLGGNLAVYAALTRPGVFGRCLAMSPMTWMVEDELLAAAAAFDGDARFVLTYGTAEPTSVASSVTALGAALPGATVSAISGAVHDDVAWGQAFPSYYAYTAAGAAAPTGSAVARRPVAPRRADMATTTYHLFSKITSSTPSNADLALEADAAFTLLDNYRSGSSDATVKAYVKVIPTDVKSKYFWNLSRTADGSDFVMSGVKNVSFSSKKSCDSWLRIVVYEDESVSNVAAASNYFRINSADGDVVMAAGSGYTVTGSATFNTTDKTFTIHYGSVNSGSDMGAITDTYSVGSNCTRASIAYDFLTNRVTITETDWGEILADDYSVATFSAVPSVTTPGSSSRVTIAIDGADGYNATLTSAYNYGTASSVALTPAGTNRWTADLADLGAGIHTLSLSLSKGSAVKSDVAQINIKVFDTDHASNSTRLVANAYADVDWATTGRYKANFHAHTSQSFDTQRRTDEVVASYRDAGYRILALTDHDANSYPWQAFDVYNPLASAVDPAEAGMLAIPGVELSKDNRNNWSEATGGEFNHHNDFFTGRVGQEFASLRESYAYTNAIGGMQIINHPGQYWNLSTTYTAGEKNSPQWHAENFLTYPSLVGLEVYNQGNRRPNDRILWDQILEITMPDRPVWGYSCDDSHNADQYFRNYQHMLMPALTVDDLKQAMRDGALYFSYEYTGSGLALAPSIEAITVDTEASTITIDTEATDVRWIYSTDRNGDASTRKSTVVGIGRTFDFTGFKGKYVRALLVNDKGETCTQPFGFSRLTTGCESPLRSAAATAVVYPNPAETTATVAAPAEMTLVEVHSLSGLLMARLAPVASTATLDVSAYPAGLYLVTVTTPDATNVLKLIKR